MAKLSRSDKGDRVRPSTVRASIATRRRELRTVPAEQDRSGSEFRACLSVTHQSWQRLIESEQTPVRSGLGFILLPSDEDDVALALKAYGVDGDCSFLRHVPPSTEEIVQFQEQIRSASPDQLEALAHGFGSERWLLLDENALEWDLVEYGRGVNVSEPGFRVQRSRKTGCGRVEQWFALSERMLDALDVFRQPGYPDRGLLVAQREVSADDLVIAVGLEGQVLLAGTPGDFGSAHGSTERQLSMAGLALMIWAECHRRLRRMLSDVTAMADRMQLQAVGEYLERSRPVLEWEHRDRELLRRVRTELLLSSAVWKANEGKGELVEAPTQGVVGWTIGDLADPANVSTDTVGRIMKAAGVSRGGRGASGANRRYTAKELVLMVETVRRNNYQKKREIESSWNKLLREPAPRNQQVSRK